MDAGSSMPTSGNPSRAFATAGILECGGRRMMVERTPSILCWLAPPYRLGQSTELSHHGAPTPNVGRSLSIRPGISSDITIDRRNYTTTICRENGEARLQQNISGNMPDLCQNSKSPTQTVNEVGNERKPIHQRRSPAERD